MAQTSINDLISVLESSRVVFWQENAGLPEEERQRLWELRWNYVGSQIGATPSKASQLGSRIPYKRSIPRTMSIDGTRPPKRQDMEFVGPHFLKSSYSL